MDLKQVVPVVVVVAFAHWVLVKQIRRVSGTDFNAKRYLKAHYRFNRVVERLDTHYQKRSKAIQVKVATISIPCDETLRHKVLRKFERVNDKYEDLAVMIMERADKEYSLLYRLPASKQSAIIDHHRQWMETLDGISDTLEQHIGIQKQFIRNGRPE